MSILTIPSVVLAILLCILALLIWIAWPSVIGAPWVPTPNKRVRGMLELAQVSKDDILYDLGSGDGRIIIMAAEEFGAQSVGIEVDPIRIMLSKFRIKRRGLEKSVKVIRGNFFHISIKDATVVTLYQGHGINQRIAEKLANDLTPGSRIVSYKFIFEDWIPIQTNIEDSLYLYLVQ